MNQKKPLRIDAHQYFWRYRSQDYPWIDTDMELLEANGLRTATADVRFGLAGLPARGVLRQGSVGDPRLRAEEVIGE